MRPIFPKTVFDMINVIAKRSTCNRRKVGAIAVKDQRILATGYNGAPSGHPHCLDGTCRRQVENIPSGERHEICNALHAEQNVLIQAAKSGINLEGCTLFCNCSPCSICAKMLSEVVKTVVFTNAYPDSVAMQYLHKSGIQIISIKEKNLLEGNTISLDMQFYYNCEIPIPSWGSYDNGLILDKRDM